MSLGEYTITLQDVAYQLGLSINDDYELLDVLPPVKCIDKFTVKFTSFQKTFSELFPDPNEKTMKRYAQACLVTSPGYVFTSGGYLSPLGLTYFIGYSVEVGGISSIFERERAQSDAMKADTRLFIWMPYSAIEVVQRVHPRILEPRHTILWRAITSLICFAVSDTTTWGVQHPHQILDIDFLKSKNGRDGDHCFPIIISLGTSVRIIECSIYSSLIPFPI
ncbi:hypothetical protein Ahy_B01g056624 [Arachis hypogaea]|uniref:Aminotransferase-like plant mobile domain-containing protein n=1 Tax=Arachis hypogaea TaxID=3818 RepID=A0A445AZ98_ARAHY|nr:hypothetical protein Ahy_B01g056624 [Arachis hypogaea]